MVRHVHFRLLTSPMSSSRRLVAAVSAPLIGSYLSSLRDDQIKTGADCGLPPLRSPMGDCLLAAFVLLFAQFPALVLLVVEQLPALALFLVEELPALILLFAVESEGAGGEAEQCG